MHAVWYDRQGPANEVLVYGELPTPEPGHYEVRVRLEAAGVNPSDTYRRRGPVPAMEYPRVVTCSDGAGVVEAVGSGVTRVGVGDRVCPLFFQSWFSGPVTALWPSGPEAGLAIARDLASGEYIAYVITISCAR